MAEQQTPMSEADRETWLEDPALTITQEIYAAEADAKVRVARIGWVLAFIGWGGLFLFAYLLVKTQQSWMGYRPPFVWANAQGTPMLVTSETKDKAYDEVPENIVKGTILQYLDMRFAVSEYHARTMWPRLMTFWLRPSELKPFMEQSSKDLASYRKENLWRRVTPSYIQIDKRDPVPGGGSRYDAQVEFLTDDLKADEAEPKRTQWWRVRLSFTLGTPFGVSDREQFEAVSKMNPLNWRNVMVYEPVPISVPTRRATEMIDLGLGAQKGTLVEGSLSGGPAPSAQPVQQGIPVGPQATPAQPNPAPAKN